MKAFITEVFIQSCVCGIGFIAGLLYARERFMPVIRRLKARLSDYTDHRDGFRAQNDCGKRTAR